jgi:hypothetical protein
MERMSRCNNLNQINIENNLPIKDLSAAEFLQAALADPEQPVQKYLLNQKNHDSNYRLACRFLLEGWQLEQIINSEKLGYSRQNLSEKISGVVRSIHAASSQALQQEYPFQRIKIGNRPRSADAKIAAAIKGNPDLGRFFRKLDSGLYADPADIIEILGIPPENLSAFKDSLKKLGIKLNTISQSGKKAVEIRAKTENPDRKAAQETLNQLSLKDCFIFSRGENSILLTLQNTIRGYFYPNTSDFIHFARVIADDTGYPLIIREFTDSRNTVHRYYFITRYDLEPVRKLLLGHQDLQRYRSPAVVQIGGPDNINIPNTSAIKHGNDYDTVIRLLNSLGIRLNQNNCHTVEELIAGTDCPVAIFKYGEIYYFPKSGREKLIAYLKNLNQY